MKNLCAVLMLVLLLVSCAANQNARRVVIRNPNLLIISDMATDNTAPFIGNTVDASGNIPISGVPLPVDLAYKQGGIMSANEIIIEAATGGTVIIERGVSGNSGVDLNGALERVFVPVQHPFGNITVDQGSAMREHVIEEGVEK